MVGGVMPICLGPFPCHLDGEIDKNRVHKYQDKDKDKD
jgi:hypothetical protein